jgi:predicted kinase
MSGPGRVPATVLAAAVRETHAAVVVLLGDRAYKVKKPVDLGFLDFVIDASFAEPRHRRMAEDLAGRVFADLTAFHCLAPEHVVRRRLLARESRPDRWSDAGADIGSTLAEEFQPWPTAAQLDTSDDPDSTLRSAIAILHPAVL